MNIGWVLTIILLVFLLMVLASCVKIVPQAQAMVVERLGGYLATWSPLILPLILLISYFLYKQYLFYFITPT